MIRSARSIEASRAIVLAVACLTATGCVLPDQLQSLQQDMSEVRAELARLRTDQEAVSRRIEQVQERSENSDPVRREEFAAVRADMDELRRNLTALDDRIDETARRMDRLSLDIQTNRELARRPPVVPVPLPGEAGSPEPPDPTGEPTASDAIPNPEALYNTAYADFSKGNFELAVSGFQEYANRFPEADLADNALYWIGECRFSQGNYSAAVEAFDVMLERYGRSDKAPAANLMKALAYLEMNRIGQAIVQFEHVVATYPSSDEARVARDRLSALGASPGRS